MNAYTLAAAAILWCLSAPAFAQSQPPPPGPPELGQQQQPKAGTKATEAAPDQPISVDAASVQAVSPQPHTEPERDQAPQDDQPSPDDKQWWYATLPDWIMAVFTVVLSGLAILQWKASQRSNDLTSVIERSYLSLGKVTLVRMEVGKELVVRVPIRNSGRTPAFMGKLIAKSFYGPPSSSPQPIDTTDPGRGAALIPAGEESPFEVTFFGVALDQSRLDAIKAGSQRLTVLLYVDFRDDLTGYVRCAGFARYLNPQSNEFLVESRPEYSYLKDLR